MKREPMRGTGRSEIESFAKADLVLLVARLMSDPARARAAALEVGGQAMAPLAEAAGAPHHGGLAEALTAVLDQVGETDPARWRDEFTRLFNGPVQCPVNETAYVRRDKGAIIGDICGFYRAFGFEPDHTSGEKADHLVCELEFLGAILVMLGVARRGGGAERVEIVEGAVRSYLSEHLGEWIGLFCTRLAVATDLELYRQATVLLGELWDLLAHGFDLPRFDALDVEVSEDDEPDVGSPYECDMAGADGAEFVPLTGPPGCGLPES